MLFGAALGAFYFTLNRLDNVRTELKADIASAADKADAANEHHLIIRGDLKILAEKIDCIQKQVDKIEHKVNP